ncbi:MAG: DHH family phosphoesterase [Methanobrevibacter sp.]|uniref:DHH family phosphoesterase n=1 Tax=Methanobrevibacter sp. TaxID=66852 RepID=UPI0025DA2EA8|nr:DHH family phosphoesterase [Methanobrevibacter sp.]MBQ6099243.1 DHH family phosphoesterase [Methanobrevibacter sp.]
MKTKCPKCKGTGSVVVDYKECESCGGTGYEDDLFDVGSHFKGVNSKARDKFDLGGDEDIPCEACNGKGQVEVYGDCPHCKGTGQINVCRDCGALIDEDEDICSDCNEKRKVEKMKHDEYVARQNQARDVYVLDSLCKMSDIDKDRLYRGKITRIERYGAFVTLNNNVWGLMRGDVSEYNVGDDVIVFITAIKSRENKIDLAPAYVDKYRLIKLTKSLPRTLIKQLESKKGKTVRIDGEVQQIQQTSGPTIFMVSDESGVTEIAAFDKAGERSYPEIEVGDAVQVLGEVNEHSGKTQIESSSMTKLNEENTRKLRTLIDAALNKRAEPEDVDFLVKSDVLNRLKPKMREAAQKIRRAILDGRTILLRHHNDADGICAGVAMEKALIPLIEEVNPSNDAQYYYFKRSPSKAPFYELEDVVKDLSFALEDQERHGQKLPLIVLLDNGSTEEDIVALMQAKIYDIEVVVIDHHSPGDLLTKDERNGEIYGATVAVDEYVDTHVNPYLVGGDSQLTAGALATEVAHIINPEVKEIIKHLPAVAALGDHAECGEVYQYLQLASEKGFNKEHLAKIAECVDFEAYFLRFMNGRGIMDTILAVDNLDKHEKMIDALYKEYLKRVDTQLKAALPNIKRTQLENGIYFNLIDVEKYAHKFTFPAPGKTCGFVHDHVIKEIGDDKPIVTLGHGPDFGVFRATDAVAEQFGFNVNDIVSTMIERVPSAGIDGGGHECAGSIKYIEGLGEEVLYKVVEEIQSLSRK